MARFYSPSNKGFYDSRIHHEMPDDAIELSDDHYRKLAEGQLLGLSIQYNDGRLDLVAIEPSIPTVLRMLEGDLHKYIEEIHNYSIPNQATLQALATDPAVPEDIRYQCRSVSRWIQDTVLPYYYKVKADILGSDKPGQVVWNFTNACDLTAPGVILSSVISRLG